MRIRQEYPGKYFFPLYPKSLRLFFEGTRQVQGREVGKMGKNPQGCITDIPSDVLQSRHDIPKGAPKVPELEQEEL